MTNTQTSTEQVENVSFNGTTIEAMVMEINPGIDEITINSTVPDGGFRAWMVVVASFCIFFIQV